jgi:hypothetical protein
VKIAGSNNYLISKNSNLLPYFITMTSIIDFIFRFISKFYLLVLVIGIIAMVGIDKRVVNTMVFVVIWEFTVKTQRPPILYAFQLKFVGKMRDCSYLTGMQNSHYSSLADNLNSKREEAAWIVKANFFPHSINMIVSYIICLLYKIYFFLY